MTRIDFYTHASDKHQLACRLCAKALGQGLRINVYTQDAHTAERLDKLLWSFPATGFIPHCRADDALAGVTPVILHHEAVDFSHDDILLNLHNEWPPFFSRFQRLIEIVSTDEQDTQAARQRYRFYQDRGYAIQTHDMRKHQEKG